MILPLEFIIWNIGSGEVDSGSIFITLMYEDQSLKKNITLMLRTDTRMHFILKLSLEILILLV